VAEVASMGASVRRSTCNRNSRYETDGCSTSWLKIENPDYSPMVGSAEGARYREKCAPASSAGLARPCSSLGRSVAYFAGE
jgi:hypothetical protein